MSQVLYEHSAGGDDVPRLAGLTLLINTAEPLQKEKSTASNEPLCNQDCSSSERFANTDSSSQLHLIRSKLLPFDNWGGGVKTFAQMPSAIVSVQKCGSTGLGHGCPQHLAFPWIACFHTGTFTFLKYNEN